MIWHRIFIKIPRPLKVTGQLKEVRHEKNIPAQCIKAQAYPRISCTHGNKKWSPANKPSPGQGPEASGRLIVTLDQGSPVPESSFGRNKRLLTARAYQAVFSDTCYKVAHPNLLLLAKPNGLCQPRLGLVVAKKNIRRSVDRNRVKRVVRETFRHSQSLLDSLDIVFLARQGMDRLTPREQTDLLENSWRRLSRKLQAEQ